MVYKWKFPGLFPVDAQTAGEELNRIYKLHSDTLEPAAVVEESRPVSSPLHPVFEWDDTKAAELYRESQAAQLIRAVIVVNEHKDAEPQDVRAFVHAQHTYHPITVAINSEDMMRELLTDALCDMQAFKRKYEVLTELSPVLMAMDVVLAEKGA